MIEYSKPLKFNLNLSLFLGLIPLIKKIINIDKKYIDTHQC